MDADYNDRKEINEFWVLTAEEGEEMIGDETGSLGSTVAVVYADKGCGGRGEDLCLIFQGGISLYYCN